jgi:ketosteroid isomerase-like protein
VTADWLVGRLFQVVDSRMWDELGEVFADDAVYERPGYPALEGLDRIRHFYEHERIIASGAAKDGAPLDEGFADTYLVRDGKIAYRRTYFYRPAI